MCALVKTIYQDTFPVQRLSSSPCPVWRFQRTNESAQWVERFLSPLRFPRLHRQRFQTLTRLVRVERFTRGWTSRRTRLCGLHPGPVVSELGPDETDGVLHGAEQLGHVLGADQAGGGQHVLRRREEFLSTRDAEVETNVLV